MQQDMGEAGGKGKGCSQGCGETEGSAQRGGTKGRHCHTRSHTRGHIRRHTRGHTYCHICGHTCSHTASQRVAEGGERCEAETKRKAQGKGTQRTKGAEAGAQTGSSGVEDTWGSGRQPYLQETAPSKLQPESQYLQYVGTSLASEYSSCIHDNQDSSPHDGSIQSQEKFSLKTCRLYSF